MGPFRISRIRIVIVTELCIIVIAKAALAAQGAVATVSRRHSQVISMRTCVVYSCVCNALFQTNTFMLSFQTRPPLLPLLLLEHNQLAFSKEFIKRLWSM